MIVRRTSIVLGLLAGLAPAFAGAQGYSEFEPTGLLVPEGRQRLPLVPLRVVAFDDGAYVIGNGDDGPRILRIEGEDLQVTAAAALDMIPSDVIASEDSASLFVIGSLETGQTRVQVFDRALGVAGALDAPVGLGFPTLSLGDGGRLLAGGIPTATQQGGLLTLDVSDPAAPVPVPELMPQGYDMFGIAGAWLEDVHATTLFISTALLPALVAVEVGEKGFAEIADLDVDDGSDAQEPLTIFASMSSRGCLDDTEATSFLISSNVNETLYLAVFDPDFKSLDVVSRTKADLVGRRGSSELRYPESKVLVPTTLLSASCDLGVVWIGDIKATEVEQFAVDPGTMTIEKVGELPLPDAASGLAISASGRTAYVISESGQTIARYRSGDGGVSGTDGARALQRLLTERGFPVGAIDGEIGAKTLSAVARFEALNKVDLDIRGNLEGALQILQDAPRR